MESGPVISVVITCFNYEHYVGQAIESVVGQGCDVVEVLVIDDGSTDGSWEVIQRSGVRAFRLKNAGQRQACLYGLSVTRAPFVLFLDADDALQPGSLNKIIPFLEAGVSKLQYRLTCIDSDGRVIKTGYPAIGSFRDECRLVDEVLRTAVYQSPPTSGNVFRRDVCHLLREVDYENAVDGVILFIAPFMGQIVSLADDLGLYRIHGRNESGLGRPPQIQTFERDLCRFEHRVEHLGRLIERFRPNSRLVAAKDTFYFKITEFYVAVAKDGQYHWRRFASLLQLIAMERRSFRWKLGSSIYLIAVYILPNWCAQSLLRWRLSLGNKSIVYFIRLLKRSLQKKHSHII